MNDVAAMNLQSENNFLRRALMFAEANLGAAAAMADNAGLKGEGAQFHKDAAYCRTVRKIVATAPPKS